MRTKTPYFLFFLGTLFFFAACNNDDDAPMLPEECIAAPPDYFPLEVGNYWIYEVYRINSDSSSFLKYDTVNIIGTETVNGEAFYVMESQKNPYSATQLEKKTTLVRDSLGFLINSSSVILFSSEVFDEVVYTSEIGGGYFEDYRTLSTPQNFSVPAGDFESLNYQGRIYKTNDPDFQDVFYDNLYVNGIGKIFQNATYVSNPWSVTLERRLVEYYLE